MIEADNPDDIRISNTDVATDKIVIIDDLIRYYNSEIIDAQNGIMDYQSTITRARQKLNNLQQTRLYCVREIKHYYGIAPAESGNDAVNRIMAQAAQAPVVVPVPIIFGGAMAAAINQSAANAMNTGMPPEPVQMINDADARLQAITQENMNTQA